MSCDQSVPLSRALERFSDPSDWQELCSLEPYRILMFILGEPETEDERLHWRYHSLKEQLEAELLDKLITGTLVATGEVEPRALDREPQIIPARLWQELEPDFTASEATGVGLRIVKIRVEPGESFQRRLAHKLEAYDQASLARLRAEVRRWLQREALVRETSWYKDDYRKAARSEFGDRVTDNLFNGVWTLADLPASLRKPGLRKKRVRPTSPSPPD